MIGGAVLLVLLSAVFFVLWQYFESPWLILGYILTILAVCVVVFLIERRKNRRILDRFERILSGESADHIADAHLTPTERRLIMRLCELEVREAKVQDSYRSISSLVADIAHQSKTPLSSILMYTEMSEHGEVIRTQTEKLSFLMDSLTKLAKCEGGLIAENLSPKENSVKELLRQVIEAGYAAADALRLAMTLPAIQMTEQTIIITPHRTISGTFSVGTTSSMICARIKGSKRSVIVPMNLMTSPADIRPRYGLM